jgi:hypothetical protein
VSKDGKLGVFYKEDVQSLYYLRKKSAKYVEGYGYCCKCQSYYPVRIMIIDAPTTIYLKNITNKEEK